MKNEDNFYNEIFGKALNDIENTNNAIADFATLSWKIYASHVNAGFTPEQAMAILISIVSKEVLK